MIFLTHQLWRAVRHPKWQHPMLQYIRMRPTYAAAPSPLQRTMQALVIVALILVTIRFPSAIFIGAIATIITLPVLAIIFNSTALGAYWATRITARLSDSHHHQQFDLMRLTPLGGLGSAWHLAIAEIHHNDVLRQVYTVVRRLSIILLIGLTLVVVALVMVATATSNAQLQQIQVQLAGDVMLLLLLVAAFWVDHIQSILIALFLSLLLPTIMKQTVGLRVIVPLIYLLLQIMTYMLVGLSFVLWQSLLLPLLGETALIAIVALLLALLSLYGLREVLIVILVRLIARAYDATWPELQEVIHPSQ